MKRIVLTIALVAMSCAAFAQNFGVKVGGNLSTWNGVDNSKSILGCYIGGVVDLGLPVANLGLRIEPAYSMQGCGTEVTAAKITTKTRTVSDCINVPVMLEYKLLGGDLALMAGPQAGFCLGMSGKTTIGDADPKDFDIDKDAYKALDFGVVLGATYMLTGNVGIDLRYNLGLSDITPEDAIFDTNYKNRVLSLGVSFMF